MIQNHEDRIQRFLGQFHKAGTAGRGIPLHLPSMVKRPVSFAGMPLLVRRPLFSRIQPGAIRID